LSAAKDEETEAALIAVRHSVRRAILQEMKGVKLPARGVSPRDLAKRLNVPLPTVSYHTRILVACEMIRLSDTQHVRGALRHFYKPTDRSEHPVVRAALAGDDG